MISAIAPAVIGAENDVPLTEPYPPPRLVVQMPAPGAATATKAP